MPISKVFISNCKSISKLNIDFSDITCLIGKNGSGKSNILKSINHFYQNLIGELKDDILFDKNNRHNDYIEISIVYDFSKLKRISETRYSKDALTLHEFFSKILFDFSSYMNSDNLVQATLKQFKTGEKQWNIPFELRSFLKNVFPLYFIQSRNIKLTDWQNIWEIVGDMSKLREKEEGKFSQELDTLYEKIYGKTYKKNLDYIKMEFQKNDIELDKMRINEKLTQIYQLQIGGRSFKFKDESLDFFSDGINSSNYMKLLVNLVSKLAISKIKEPMIIIDEPELGLHPKLADELTASLFSNSKLVRFLLATHSSRVIKNIIDSETGTLLHVSMKSNYTQLKKMKRITSAKEKTIVTETEASYYFSKGILFVEGPTELELFNNRKLQGLFPILKEIDVYSYGSNNLKLNLIHPSKMNASIPFIVLLDMDKVIKIEKNKVIIKGDTDFSPLSNEGIIKKEKFYYGKKRVHTVQIRKRIQGISNKAEFIPVPRWYYLSDELYSELLNLIKKYSLEYNVFPVTTTIEGTIINIANYEIFRDYFVKIKGGALFERLYQQCTLPEERLTLMRALVSGKCDTLRFLGEHAKHTGDSELIQICKHIGSIKFDKTEGWVSSFLDYFFDHYLEGTKDRIETFKLYFNELYDIIITLVKQVRQSE